MRSTTTCSDPRAVWPPGARVLAQAGVWSAVVALALSATGAHGGVITTGSLDGGTTGTADLSPGNKLLWTTTTQDDSWYSVDVFSLPRQEPGDFTFQLPGQYQSFRQRSTSGTEAPPAPVSAGSSASGGQATGIDLSSPGDTGGNVSDGTVGLPVGDRDPVTVPGVFKLSSFSGGAADTGTAKSGTDGGDAGDVKAGSGGSAGDGKPTASGSDGGDTKPAPGSGGGDMLDPGVVGLGDNPARQAGGDATPALTGSTSGPAPVTSSNPEPPTVMLLGIGGLALGWLAHRFRRRRQLAAA